MEKNLAPHWCSVSRSQRSLQATLERHSPQQQQIRGGKREMRNGSSLFTTVPGTAVPLTALAGIRIRSLAPKAAAAVPGTAAWGWGQSVRHGMVPGRSPLLRRTWYHHQGGVIVRIKVHGTLLERGWYQVRSETAGAAIPKLAWHKKSKCQNTVWAVPGTAAFQEEGAWHRGRQVGV
jgi:hypothetical protein